MTADLDVLLREVDDVKQELARHNGVNVDSNAIFESLELNGYRENRVEFVVRQFLGEDELNEIGIPDHDNGIEYVAAFNGGGATIDLTIDIAEKKMPLFDTNGSISKGESSTVTEDIINVDSESYSSDSSVELLTKKPYGSSKVKRKYETTAEPKKRKKQNDKSCFDSSVQVISSESSKDASTSDIDNYMDLYDINNNDPNNNFEHESSFQQAHALSAQQATGESEFLNLPSTSKADINAPSCSFQASAITNTSFKYSPEEDLPSDDDGDTQQLNNEDLLELNQEGIREELLTEARFIHNLVPHQHLDEIFSYLEANLDSEDRMNVVLLNFLQRDKQRDDSGQQKQLPSLPLASTFSEKDDTVTASHITYLNAAKKTDVEPVVPNPDCIANTYSEEVEICSISDDEQPAIKTKMDIGMNSESVTAADDISKINIDCTLGTRVPNGISASTLLDLTNKAFINEENVFVQKHKATLIEMFPNLPKQLIEQQCKKIGLEGGSLEGLVLKLLEIDSESEVKEVPPEENLARELPERHSAAGNSSSAVSVNSYLTESVVENTTYEEQEEEEEVEELRYKTLLAIFPDADPDFLREKAGTLPQDDENFRNFIITNLERKGYPSLKDYEQRQERAAIKKKYSEEFSVQAFLDAFPDPLNYFKERKSLYDEKTSNYAFNYLKNKFRWLRMEILKEVYHKHEHNLSKAFEELQNIQNRHDRKKKERKQFRLSQRLVAEYPKFDELDVPFLQEIAFLDHKDEIDAHLKEKAERRQKAFEEAKEKGELLECSCCYDNEIMSEDIRSCEEGHLFCKECVKRSAEIAIGEGKTSFPCLTSCQSEFSLKVLQTALKPDIFSKMLKRKQLEEIKQAGIEGLETCPFCDFASIPEEGNKIFHCLNPECMKESCRACRQPSHIPLRCEEVEKADEVKMRTYIEDRMTQALVRECWRCKQKFVKEDGCNKMKCHCGALMCYVCRQPVRDYTHFNGQGGTDYHKCPLYSNNDELHVTAVEQEGLKAKKEVEQQNPDLKLKHDPTKNLPKAKYKRAQIRNYHDRDRDICIHLRDAIERMRFFRHEARRRRPRRMRAHLGHNAPQMVVRPRVMLEGPDGIENVHAGPAEVLEPIHEDFINLTANITPAPTQARTMHHVLVHDADPTNRVQEPPVWPADDARANEMQPLPIEMRVNDERPLIWRIEELSHRPQKNQRKHVRYSTRPHNQHANHATPVMPSVHVSRVSFSLPYPTRETIHYGAPEYPQPRPRRQATPAHHNVQTPAYTLTSSVRQPMPAHQNEHTPKCIQPGPATRQTKRAPQNEQTFKYIQPGPARQVRPAQQNVQTPKYIQPGPARQVMPAQQNVQTPKYIQPGPARQVMPTQQNVQTPKYIQPGPARQVMPAQQNVQTPKYIQPGPARQVMPTQQNVQTPKYIQPDPAKQVMPTQQNVQTPEYIQPGPVIRQAMPAHQNVRSSVYIQRGLTRQVIHYQPNFVISRIGFIRPDSDRQDVPDMEDVVFDPVRYI